MKSTSIRKTLFHAQEQQAHGNIHTVGGECISYDFYDYEGNDDPDCISFDDKESTLGVISPQCCSYIDYQSITHIDVYFPQEKQE